jgi:TolB protein
LSRLPCPAPAAPTRAIRSPTATPRWQDNWSPRTHSRASSAARRPWRLALGQAASPAEKPTTRKAPPAKRLGRIVFSSDRSGAWRIWTIEQDGTGLKQLTKGKQDGHDVDPAFSPDLKSILFTSTRGGKAGVWTMSLDGTKPKRICDGDQASGSPDGKRIAFRRAGRILTRELKSGKERAITPKGWTACSGPAWGPDGKTLAFARLKEGANAVYLVAAAGGEPKLLFGKKGACEPRWSPDGRAIVYETETHLFTIGADGTNNRMITWYGGLQRYAQWSPDGREIVFCQGASTKGPWELYIVPSTGGTPRKLTDGGSDMYPDWR